MEMTTELVEGKEIAGGRRLMTVPSTLSLPPPTPVLDITNQSWHSRPLSPDMSSGSCSTQSLGHSCHTSSLFGQLRMAAVKSNQDPHLDSLPTSYAIMVFMAQSNKHTKNHQITH